MKTKTLTLNFTKAEVRKARLQAKKGIGVVDISIPDLTKLKGYTGVKIKINIPVWV